MLQPQPQALQPLVLLCSSRRRCLSSTDINGIHTILSPRHSPLIWHFITARGKLVGKVTASCWQLPIHLPREVLRRRYFRQYVHGYIATTFSVFATIMGFWPFGAVVVSVQQDCVGSTLHRWHYVLDNRFVPGYLGSMPTAKNWMMNMAAGSLLTGNLLAGICSLSPPRVTW